MSGKVRFQVAQVLDDGALGHVVFDRTIGTAVSTLDTYEILG